MDCLVTGHWMGIFLTFPEMQGMQASVISNGSHTRFVEGKILKGLDLDGTDDYLSVAHDSGIDLRRTVSFSVWVKLDTIGTGYTPLIYKGGGGGGGTRTYSLWIQNSNKYFHGTSADSSSQEQADSANNAISINEWFHAVLLVDRTNGFIRVYKNNALVANDTTRSTDSVTSQNSLLFGATQESSSEYKKIDGQIDDIRLYNRVLTTTEIALLYNSANTDDDSDGLSNAEETLLDINSSASDTDGDGLTDFQEVKGYHSYEQINGSFSWPDAKADAESRGGYLATITSSAEKSAVEQARTVTEVWLGGSDADNEGSWAWVTGEEWSYQSWNSSEPNGGTGENYLIIWTSDGNWNDITSRTVPYILEKEYYSDPKEIDYFSSPITSSDKDGDGFSDTNESLVGSDPSSSSSTPLQKGLVAHWKFDEQKGTTAVDSSGNDYHAHLFGAGDGSSVWVDGRIGGAIELNGSSDYLAIQGLNYDQQGQIPAVTTSAWVKTSQTSKGMIMSFDRSEYWRLSIGGELSNGRTFFASKSTSDASPNNQEDIYGTTVVNDGTWHHIAVSYSTSDGMVRFYVDGGLDHSAGAHSGNAIGKGDLRRFGIIGTNCEDGSYNTMSNNNDRPLQNYNGLIDDARIYDRALSAYEISKLYLGEIQNTPPGNLAINGNQITENQPLGTTVGQFQASDSEGDAMTFHLVSGAGDTGNHYFTLESNGSLKSAVSFDYENNASSYSIRVQVRDEHNAMTEGNFTVSLIDLDDTAPVISLTGPTSVTHEAGTTYLDQGANWSDGDDGTGTITGNGEVNVQVPGTYTISYDKTDNAGNAALTVTRTVNVVDTQKPVIQLLGDTNVSIVVWQTFTDAGVSATDSLDGNLTASVQVIGDVNTSHPGIYTLTYRVSDQVGNQAIDVQRTVTVFNQSPTGITLSATHVEENRPAGTMVGQFSTTDPDDPEEVRTYTYSLFDAQGNQSDQFTVNTSGDLFTSVTFDFEQNESHDLIVRSTDQFGGYFSKQFEVFVEDTFVPIVQTEVEGNVTGRKIAVLTKLLDAGQSSDIEEWGVLASGSPIQNHNQSDIVRYENSYQSGQQFLNVLVTASSSWTKLYVRGYARNEEGTGIGGELMFDLFIPDGGGSWSSATPHNDLDSWWQSPWWGSFYQSATGWFFHAEMGWIFPVSGDSGSVWLWKNDMGWLWTKGGLFPFLYRFDSTNWLYFFGDFNGEAVYYDYRVKDFIKMNNL